METKEQIAAAKGTQDATVPKNPEGEYGYDDDNDDEQKLHIAASTSDCSSWSGDESDNNEAFVLLGKPADSAGEKVSDNRDVDVGNKLPKLTPTVDAATSGMSISTADRDFLQARFQKLLDLSMVAETKQEISAGKPNCDPTNKEETTVTPDKNQTMASKTETTVVPDKDQTKESKSESEIDQSDKQNESENKVAVSEPQLENDTKEDETQQSSSPAPLEALQFEAQYTGFAVSAFLCYCVAHLAIYELIYGLLLELSDSQVQKKYLLYSGLMVAGLVILRFTGLLWQFLSRKRYRSTKREMRKRESWDAKLMDWIEEKPILKTTLDIVGFYLCYIAFAFFWYEFLSNFDQRDHIYSMLPSTQYYEQVVRDPLGSLAVNETVTNEAESSCAWTKRFDEEDYEFMYYNVAKSSYYQYSGNSEAPLYTVAMGATVYISAALLSLFCLAKVDYGFVNNW